jgi:MobA/MobL family.
MAIYHASVKSFSRGKGESSIAAAAYRAGLDLVDTKTRGVHRFSSRKGVAAHFMLAPAGAPSWCSDARVFWDANEAWESRQNARVARELEVSLPSELGPDRRQALALELGQLLVDRYKAVVLVAIHQPSEKGDQRNHHVHLLMSAREIGPEGFGVRAGAEFDARGGRGAEEVRAIRALVSETINASLASAGIDDRVDHRSLKDQARAAEAVGDFDKAAELSRPPTKHVGKAVTAALRREGSDLLLGGTGIVQSPSQRSMAEAVERFRQKGRLAATSIAHGPSSAREERAREQAKSGVQEIRFQAPRAGARPAAHTPSAKALQLSRLARISKSSGNDAELLNEQAHLVEEWLASQNELARSALESLEAIPGLQVEQAMRDAMETALTRRVGVYASKPFFFEGSEALTAAIVEYAAAIRHPHEMRERVERARAQLSERETERKGPTDPRLARAKQILWKAKAGVAMGARIQAERRINEARNAMTVARDAMERDYYITPLHRVETSPPLSYTAGAGGGERKSESNQRQLKPNSRPRV